MRSVSKQKRDATFLKLFRTTFGEAKDTVVIWGAGYKPQSTYATFTPTDSPEHFKSLLLSAGYKVLEVHE
jgi:hypothetical protein